MKTILCVDYNHYVIPENVDINMLLRALSHPANREYVSNGKKRIFRSKAPAAPALITFELVDDSVVDPPLPAAPADDAP